MSGFLDTSLVVRYLTRDVPQMADQAAEVIDGRWSVVFDQAENRLHAQKALMVRLMGRT